MINGRALRRLALAACAAALAVTGLTPAGAQAAPGPAPSRALGSGTRFYVDPHSEAAHQALSDLRAGHLTDARNMAELASWPEAVWLTDGTPRQVGDRVRGIVRAAKATRSVPLLVLYNVPGRDCGSYSAGGAADSAAYDAWVKAVAGAIGTHKAVVIVEPDSLALLPKDCGPDTDPTGSLTTARIAEVRSAVGTLEADPATSVYLDAGNSKWLPVGEITGRLIDAGLRQAQGFALNISNYQPTDQLNRYGTWVSKCVWYATESVDPAGRADQCASQYYSSAAPNDGLPGDAVESDDPSTWHWTDAWYDSNVGTPPADRLTHYVLDTSRNGRGAWTAPPGKYTDDESWCNAPGRGVGNRPTTGTGVPLADAYLYVKTIGQSDGTCHRGTAGPGDPEYGGVEDPPAGAWWPDFAHTLAGNANPPLTFNHAH